MADGEQPQPELRSGAQADTTVSQSITVLAERPKNVEIESKGEIVEGLPKDVKGKAPEDALPEEPNPQPDVEQTPLETAVGPKTAKMELLVLPYDLKSLILSYVSLSASFLARCGLTHSCA